MTQTTPTKEPPAHARANPNPPLLPSDILMTLIVALLSPMFLSVSGGDISYARMAATETVNAYRIRNQADLILIAQIIAFGLAALGSLSLSMADDISLSMILRLRGNANALNRAAEQNRRALSESHGDDPQPRSAAPEADTEFQAAAEGDFSDAGMIASVSAALQRPGAEAAATMQHPAQSARALTSSALTPNETAAEKRHHAMWAIALVKEAGELTASIPNLPIVERKAASIRAALLGSTANELLTGASSPPPIPVGRVVPGQPPTI